MFGLFKNRKEKKLQAVRSAVAHDAKLVITAASVLLPAVDQHTMDKYPGIGVGLLGFCYSFGIVDYLGQSCGLQEDDALVAYGIYLCQQHGATPEESYAITLQVVEAVTYKDGQELMTLGGQDTLNFIEHGTPPMGLKHFLDDVIKTVGNESLVVK